jgi:hypothetical protein
MTAIRFGTFTIYKGIEMSVSEYYGHGLDQDIEKKHLIISYTQEYGQLEGFNFIVESNNYKKDILVKDLENAYFVVTKALYSGEVFEVEPYFGDDIHLHLATKDLELGKKLGFYELHDSYGKPYYLGEIPIVYVEKIWEERQASTYNAPFPEKLEAIKILKST